MQRILFLLTYPILWLLSILPFCILHLVSDLLFLLVYYLIGYRKNLVLKNLQQSFPDKDEKELLHIRRKFYRHFTDLFIETIKSFTISEKELERRYKYTNKEIFKEIEALDKSVIMMGAHYANWEWIINIQSKTSLKCIGAYTRLSNPNYDKLIRKNRSRFGSEFVPTSKTIKKLIHNKNKSIRSLYGLLSDQSPQIHKTHYWAPFLGVTVPIHTGAEMLAKKHDFCVVYMSVCKTKRSTYEIAFEILEKNPREVANYEITDTFLKKVEEQIVEKPEFYFWTHNRFKHKDKAPK